MESVAWVAERKDVLSGFFALLTLGAYLSWVRRPTRLRSTGVVLLFAAGLMAKPMLVTLPFVLLLLDWWPLGRTARGGARAPGRDPGSRAAALVLEKWPLLLLTAASATVTWVAQQRAGAIRPLEAFPPAVRLAQAPVSAARYLLKTLWPFDLAVFYPHPAAVPPWWHLALAAATLAGITALAVRTRRTRPFIAVGWLWFLGTLVPVIGLVQVGNQLIADRYTYLPLIGLFVAAVWSVARERGQRTLLTAAAVVFLAVMTVFSRAQIGAWRNGETLFTHALARTQDNWLAHNILGTIRLREGRLVAATDHFREAVRIRPEYRIAHFNLANALAARGELAAAAPHYEEALHLDPPYPGAYRNYGNALMSQGRFERAAAVYRSALDLEPASAENHRNLGEAYLRLGRGEDARGEFKEALRLRPGAATAGDGPARR